MVKLVQIALVFGLLLGPSADAFAQSSRPRERSTQLHLAGAIGVTAAFQDNLMLAAPSIDLRVYAPEGLGVLVRVGYEGLIFLNFGIVDLGVAVRREVPGGDWAGLGLNFGLGFSAMIRDSVYHFTGDDLAFGMFGTAGLDVRLGSLVVGLDIIGRWQAASHPIDGQPARDQDHWFELGAAIRIGGEVLL
jgi:hypothetical protein